jgi:hypothetical protein
VLGGLDALVFSAGIGENLAPVRAEVYHTFSWLAVTLDEAASHATVRAFPEQPSIRVGHPDELGTDDRAAHLGTRAPLELKLPRAVSQLPSRMATAYHSFGGEAEASILPRYAAYPYVPALQ